jgi:hypothetical protein
MGKRSDFERKPRDFYPTPYEGVVPLIPHLPSHRFFYAEPCAGNLDLCKHIMLASEGRINVADSFDIEPQNNFVVKKDALTLTGDDLHPLSEMIITNPPWDRKLLHPMIEHFSSLKPTWLLFDADWAHTRQSSTLIKRCVKIVSVGRLKWIPDSKMSGKDNCAWYLFDANHSGDTVFVGR